MSARRTSPTTAASAPCRRPSSIIASTSRSSRPSAKIRRSGLSPTCSSPGAYRSNRLTTHRTRAFAKAAARAAIPATKRVAAASSLSAGAVGAISCRAAPSRPRSASRSSISATAKGRAAVSRARTSVIASRRCARISVRVAASGIRRIRLIRSLYVPARVELGQGRASCQ